MLFTRIMIVSCVYVLANREGDHNSNIINRRAKRLIKGISNSRSMCTNYNEYICTLIKSMLMYLIHVKYQYYLYSYNNIYCTHIYTELKFI